MNPIMKLGFVILLASVVVNTAPVQDIDDVVIGAVVDDTDGVDGRESRSLPFDYARRLGIPWYLDRIDQRNPQLDKKYNAFANGKL